MATHYLDFEKPIADLEAKIAELSALSESAGSFETEVAGLRRKAEQLRKKTYANLDPWMKTQVARHPQRPHFVDYVEGLFTDWNELHGDRQFGDDQAVLGGLARFRGRPVVVMGHEKGHDTATRITHNFGMARPEGYRKAVRLMDMAEQFGLPVLTFVDTAGAYPGLGAEERGQAEAIARSTERCLTLGVPSIATITGEGGSGGAIAIAAASRVLMLEHSIYSVISPEGAAGILWRDGARARRRHGHEDHRPGPDGPEDRGPPDRRTRGRRPYRPRRGDRGRRRRPRRRADAVRRPDPGADTQGARGSLLRHRRRGISLALLAFEERR